MTLQNLLNLSHIGIRETGGLQVLPDLIASSTAGNRDNSRHPRSTIKAKHPSEGDLNRSEALTLSETLNLFHELDVLLHGFVLEAGQPTPDVALGERGGVGKRAGEYTATEGRVCYEGDVELGAGLDDVVVEGVGVP